TGGSRSDAGDDPSQSEIAEQTERYHPDEQSGDHEDDRQWASECGVDHETGEVDDVTEEHDDDVRHTHGWRAGYLCLFVRLSVRSNDTVEARTHHHVIPTATDHRTRDVVA